MCSPHGTLAVQHWSPARWRWRLSALGDTRTQTGAMEKWLIQAPNTDPWQHWAIAFTSLTECSGLRLQPPQAWSPATRMSNEIPQDTLAALWACAVSTLVWSPFFTYDGPSCLCFLSAPWLIPLSRCWIHRPISAGMSSSTILAATSLVFRARDKTFEIRNTERI